MTRCRRTDAIADVVADPALGADALTDDQWQHAEICADCHRAVAGLERLDAALTSSMRSMRPEELPPAVLLATPPIARREPGPPARAWLAAAAVVVLAIGLAVAGSQWLGMRGVGIGPDPTASPSVGASPAPTATASPSPSLGVEPSITPAPTVTPVPTPNAEPAVLAAGELAAVVDEPLVVRTAPGTGPDSTITADQLWIGQRVRILDGPVEANGYTWWDVQVGEIRGWVADAERDDSAPWLSPIGNGRIAFWRLPAEDGVIDPTLYTINPDGTAELEIGAPTAAEMRLVISCGYSAGQVQWTHDGRLATFEHTLGGCDRQVFVMSAEASEMRKVADGWGPAWRPDGAAIAFGANVPYMVPPSPGSGEVMQVAPSGGEPEPVTDSGRPLYAAFPSWSPDRSLIAYSGSIPAEDDLAIYDFRIFVADAAGGSAREIAEGMRPAWSPDGRWIVYERIDAEGARTELRRVRPDGSGDEAIGDGRMASFSPDGDRLALFRDDGIWTMAPDGSEPARVVPAPIISGFGWSPDGRALVVSHDDAPGITSVWIVTLDGGAPVVAGPITRGHAPSWQPLLLDPRLAD